jgi:hemerythrin
MVQWNEQFETGHAVIDAQHRMLISYINRLDEIGHSTNPNREEVELFLRFVDFLEQYALTHFGEEENCMYCFRCPAQSDNKRGHLEFLDFYRGFKRQFEVEGYRPELVKELYDACAAWVQRHILRIDVQLKPCQTRFYKAEEVEEGEQE